MRKIMSILCCAALLLLMVGCSEKVDKVTAGDMPYQIVEDAGKHYLVMKPDVKPSGNVTVQSGSSAEQTAEPVGIYFDNMGEMANDIKTGNFSENELEIIAGKFPKDENNRVQICNINKLMEPVMPTGAVITLVYWTGVDYSCNFEMNNGSKGHFLRYTYEDYCEDLEYFENFAKYSQGTVSSQTTDEETGAVVTIMESGTGNIKLVYDTITVGNAEYHIAETYNPSTSEIPVLVNIMGVVDGAYFRYILPELKESPSEEWLSQFGIREYVETEVA